MKLFVTILVLTAGMASAQIGQNSNIIDVSGDAAINVPPDRVTLNFAVQTRNKDLNAAMVQNDSLVKAVISKVRELKVADPDIQTENIHVDLGYTNYNSTSIEYYEITKGIQVVLRDVSRFETLLTTILRAGANRIYDVDFSTSELRKYRDQARALAVKAAIEKADDLASAAGLKVVGKPIGLSSYSYGGGSWYSFCCGNRYGSNMVQNVVQNVSGGSGGIGPEGTVALGKIAVTASVSLRFKVE